MAWVARGNLHNTCIQSYNITVTSELTGINGMFFIIKYLCLWIMELCFPIISSIDTSLRFCLCHCFFSRLVVFGGGFPDGYTILGVPYPLSIAVSIM